MFHNLVNFHLNHLIWVLKTTIHKINIMKYNCSLKLKNRGAIQDGAITIVITFKTLKKANQFCRHLEFSCHFNFLNFFIIFFLFFPAQNH
jgi:hypothetical protein